MAIPDPTALWDPGSYWLTRLIFRRGLALVYLIAFLVAARQFRPLAGEEGLVPLERTIERRSFREAPSLFHLWPDDRVVGIAAWGGVGLSLAALVGLTDRYGLVVSMASWAVLWALYQSFVNAGRIFYGYGWESMLLETGFLAIFLGPMGVAPPAIVIWLLRWVLFRNMFGAGLIKIRGDPCWRDLSCLDFHYETQPMPNPLSWHAHHLPKPLHRISVAVNHGVELAVPFLYVAPQPVAAGAGVATIGFQGWLMLTGNFSWLNFLTIVQATTLFTDGLLAGVVPVAVPATAATPLSLQLAAWTVAGIVALLSVYPVRNLVSSRQVMNTAFDPLHLVNTYGAFGSITRERYEIVVEGTNDEELTADTDWRPYTFYGKPTDPTRRPPQVAPYHHRLGWQLWFAAMSPSPRRHPWFLALVDHLLAGDPATRSLVRDDPFPGEPPTYIRARRVRYRFSTPAERTETGQWWIREGSHDYVRPVRQGDLDRVGGW